MNVEQTTSMGARVAVHGALADPTRLRVADILALGDAASSELSERLQTPSNLLAHHLKILESAGVIERHRSEGDGRRSYWRLVHDALRRVAPPHAAIPARVVFVCTANTARSHLAAALWRDASAVPATSAGTQPGERIDPRAVAVARRRDLDLPDVRPRHLVDVTRDGDLVVTVCDRAHEELASLSDLHWSIPDPVAHGTAASFDRAYDELATRVRLFAPLLKTAS